MACIACLLLQDNQQLYPDTVAAIRRKSQKKEDEENAEDEEFHFT